MNLVGHQKVQKMVDEIIKSGKLSHAYLFVGPKSTGKSTFGRYLGQNLLCQEENAPCGKCLDCRLCEAENHPDFLVTDGGAPVGVDEIRELIHFLDLKPYQAKQKIALITHFERLSVQAANSLLKTLEEPAENTILIITAENIDNLLPTIVSRSQVVRFQNVGRLEILNELVKQGYDEDLAAKAAVLSGNRIGLAIGFCRKPEEVKEAEEFLTKMEKMLESGYADKILYAEYLAKDREEFFRKLDLAEIYFKERLNTKEALKISRILDKIAKSKDDLYHNGNPRLVAESLMLTVKE